MTPASSPTLLLVTNYGCLGTTPRWISSHLSGGLHLHYDWRKHNKFRAMSNHCSFGFFTLKASCTRNLFHWDRRWMENSFAMFWGNWGKISGTNVQTLGATTPGLCIMTTPWLMCCLLCGSFWLQQTRQSSPTFPTHQTSPPVIFSYSQRWNWSSRGDVLIALKRSRQDSRTWWRCWF